MIYKRSHIRGAHERRWLSCDPFVDRGLSIRHVRPFKYLCKSFLRGLYLNNYDERSGSNHCFGLLRYVTIDLRDLTDVSFETNSIPLRSRTFR